jgi:hypothetical protein
MQHALTTLNTMAGKLLCCTVHYSTLCTLHSTLCIHALFEKKGDSSARRYYSYSIKEGNGSNGVPVPDGLSGSPDEVDLTAVSELAVVLLLCTPYQTRDNNNNCNDKYRNVASYGNDDQNNNRRAVQ